MVCQWPPKSSTISFALIKKCSSNGWGSSRAKGIRSAPELRLCCSVAVLGAFGSLRQLLRVDIGRLERARPAETSQNLLWRLRESRLMGCPSATNCTIPRSLAAAYLADDIVCDSWRQSARFVCVRCVKFSDGPCWASQSALAGCLCAHLMPGLDICSMRLSKLRSSALPCFDYTAEWAGVAT